MVEDVGGMFENSDHEESSTVRSRRPQDGRRERRATPGRSTTPEATIPLSRSTDATTEAERSALSSLREVASTANSV